MKESLEEMLQRLDVLFIRYATIHAMADDMLTKLRENVTYMYELHEVIRATYDSQQEDTMDKVEFQPSKFYH